MPPPPVLTWGHERERAFVQTSVFLFLAPPRPAAAAAVMLVHFANEECPFIATLEFVRPSNSGFGGVDPRGALHYGRREKRERKRERERERERERAKAGGTRQTGRQTEEAKTEISQ
jgi:hypothetical protein